MQISNGIAVVKSWTRDKISAFVQWVEEQRVQISNGIAVVKSWTKDKISAFVQWVEEQRTAIKNGINTVKGWLENKFEACVKWIEQSRATISAAIDTVKDWISGIPDAIVNFISGSLQAVWDAISSIPSTITVGVNYESNYSGNSGTGNSNNGQVTGGHTAADVGKTLVDSVWSALFGGGSSKKPEGTVKPKAKGDWYVPYDNYPALLHRSEMILTASQARRYREGETGSMDLTALSGVIVSAIREGMTGAQVNSYLDGKLVTDEVSRIMGEDMTARRFA